MIRKTEIVPGYDCRVHCIHGEPKANHGQHSEEWHYGVINKAGDAAMSLVVFSGRYPDRKQNIKPVGARLTLHLGYYVRGSFYDDEDRFRKGLPLPKECSLLPGGVCNPNRYTYVGASKLFDAYGRDAVEQPETFWRALEHEFEEWLSQLGERLDVTHERCRHCDGVGVVRKERE